MQRYLIATATGILVLTLGGCAVTPIDNHGKRQYRHDGWDKKSWNYDRPDNRKHKHWDRKRERDRAQWSRDDDRHRDYWRKERL